ncbi:MAG: hypothetical protein WCH43_08945, partial [Verrucomicrobiota bacterium]
MTECNTENQAQKPKRTRWRLLRRAAACVLIVLVLFHRPLLRTALDTGLTRAAAKAHLRLTFEISGTVLNGLVLKNVRAIPDGPNHINKIEVEELRLQYNLISLLKNGPDGFLENCEARNALVEITPDLPGEHPKKKGPAMILDDVVHPPIFVARRFLVHNFNLISHTSDGDFMLMGTSVLLDPDQEGFVRVEKLQVPNVHTWNKISALVTYKGRNLSARSFSADEEVQLITAEYAPNPEKNKPCHMAFQAKAFGGTVSASLSGISRNSSLTPANFSATLRNVSLNRGFAYFSRSIPADCNIRDFDLEISGNPDLPVTWIGTASARGESGMIESLEIGNATASITASNGTAHGESVITNGDNNLRITADVPLPQRAIEFMQSTLQGELQLTANDPGRFVPLITRGKISGTGAYSLHSSKFSLNLRTIAKEIGNADFSINQAAVSFESIKLPNQKDESAPFIIGLQTSIHADFNNFTDAGYTLDSGSATLSTRDNRVTVSGLDLKRGENTTAAHGEFELPPNSQDWRAIPFNATFSVNAPALNEIYAEPQLTGLNGQLDAHGTLTRSNSKLEGHLTVSGTRLSFAEFSSEKLSVEVPVTNNIATINLFELRLNATDGVTGNGSIALHKPFAYDGKLVAAIRDLAVFNPLLQAAGFNKPVAGSLDMDWQGSGNAALMQHSGAGHLKLQKGRFGDLLPLELAVAGNYSPESIDFPTFQLEAGINKLDATVRLRDHDLEVNDIKYRLNNIEVATGSIGLPVDLKGAGTGSTRVLSIIPSAGKISAALGMKDLPVESLVPGRKLPVKGTVTGKFSAQGSLEQLDAGLQIQGRNLQAASLPKLAPAGLELDLRLRENRLALTGTLRQQEISPLQISGEIPFPVLQVIRENKIDDQSPVRLSVKLPKTSVAFLARIIPNLRFAEGQASLDAGVAGTIAKPEMHGAAWFDLPALRFQKPDWPAINGFKGDLVFSG